MGIELVRLGEILPPLTRDLACTAKNYDLFKVVENRMQQCCADHIHVHSCQQYCSALLHQPRSQHG